MYESYHYEQIHDFFTLEHQLRKRELPIEIFGGYEERVRQGCRLRHRRSRFYPVRETGVRFHSLGC